MKTRNVFAVCAPMALMLLIGCSQGKDPKASAPSSNIGVTHDEITAVQQKTDASEQWEYLIVSFGKTSFGDISENIVSGESKLAAFKEFSSLLAGYEALDLQKKMDILGRFGWDAIEMVGQIGGDQQIVFKRLRRSDRIAAEQKLVAKLSAILKEEAADKQAKLRAFNQELAASGNPETDLIELDSMEQTNREESVRNQLKTKLDEIYGSFRRDVTAGWKVKQMTSDIKASERSKGRIVVVGDVQLDFDGTGLLKRGNSYRSSEAEQALSEAVDRFLAQPGTAKASGYSWESLALTANMYVDHGGKSHLVATRTRSFVVPGFNYRD